MNQQKDFNSLLNFSKVMRVIFQVATFSVILIFVNMLQNPVDMSAISILLLLGLIILLYSYYRKGHEKFAGTGLIIVISIIVTYNFIIAGGINDNGMVIFPVLIIISGLILGKKFIPYMTGMVLSEVTVIYLLSRAGIIEPYGGATSLYFHVFAVIFMLLVMTGIIIYLTLLTIERKFRQMIEYENSLRIAFTQTIDGWGRALELFDRDTEGHSKRVTKLALDLATQLQLPDQDLEDIRRGALLHDIGKMGIAEEILNKEGSLSVEERAQINRHPLHAHVLIKDIPFLKDALDIPVYHHEQWDGNGYPYQLSGQDIPLAARIFAIADNWDALSSDRPYRKAWPVEKVIEYIREEKGKKFDPALVEQFLEIVTR